MKLNKIATICKKNKYIGIFDKEAEDGRCVRQYVGDGIAIYPIDGLPYINEESIMTIFDIPEKQRDDWHTQHAEMPEYLMVNDAVNLEWPVKEERILVLFEGKTLKPLQTNHGLVFIECRYLAPMDDVQGILELFERITPSGQVYIVVKAGFLLQALIMPYKVITEKFTDQLEDLARSCRLALQTAEERCKADEPEQMQGFAVDPETGEVTYGERGEENE